MKAHQVSSAAVMLVALGCLVRGANASPTAFTLVFDGVHVIDASLPSGIRHEGPFTASPPFCGAGTAVDVRDIEVFPLTVLRRHTCDDGTGTFTALLQTVAGEHGGSGPWKITEGTGRYANLRGIGTYTGERLSGNPELFETLVFRTKWQGVVDFDAVAPAVNVTAAATKVRRTPKTYSVRVALKALDDPPGSVAYSVDLRAGPLFLAFKTGTTTSGQAVLKLRVRPPRGVRSIQIIVTATDRVGNENSATRSLKLR